MMSPKRKENKGPAKGGRCTPLKSGGHVSVCVPSDAQPKPVAPAIARAVSEVFCLSIYRQRVTWAENDGLMFAASISLWKKL